MGHSAGRRGCLDLIVLLEPLQPLPQARSSAEQDRDHLDFVPALAESFGTEAGLSAADLHFRVGSATKAFVAALVLTRLGGHSFPLGHHLSVAPPYGDRVTIRQLLNPHSRCSPIHGYLARAVPVVGERCGARSWSARDAPPVAPIQDTVGLRRRRA